MPMLVAAAAATSPLAAYQAGTLGLSWAGAGALDDS